MRAKARRLKADQPDLGLIIIDYIQLMSGGGDAENRQQEVSAISRGLKALAKELDVPIIALSQLSRAPEQRADHRPQLSDLRESGSIEQDADLVMFLYRPEYYHTGWKRRRRARRQGRADHQQAAKRPDRRRRPVLPQGVRALRVVVGGEPGVGKSTLLLQAAARLHGTGRTALYVSGEESAAQVRLRADRLAEPAGDVLFLAEISLEAILARAAETAPSIVFIDSVQTVATDAVEGAPGNVGQVRECAARLQRFAKDSGAAVFLIGHVTKGGVVAGPRTLEHIVDTVLYFEAAEGLQHRVLRAVKNRFGGVDEIGVFRMTPSGLLAVSNPSELFLGERRSAVSGTAVAAVIEGTRPLLVEVQALCTRASYGAAQRVSTGYDRQRMTLLLAVLEKRAALPFAELDAFLNVVGGLRIVEPAGDLAVAAALASSALDRPLPADAAFIGELGLGGEIRAVSQIERRIAEAARLGFATVYAPAHALPGRPSQDLNVVGVSDIGQLLRQALG
jgi:DNA repair protein RadA/Sms